MFRYVIWLARRLRSRHQSAGSSPYAVQDASAELVTVRLPDGRLVQGERATPRAADNARGLNPTAVLMGPPDGPGPRGGAGTHGSRAGCAGPR